jgi:hypothetical protein
MTCSNPDIPKYLHYSGNEKIYKDSKLKARHLLYRTGFKENDNPIEFPNTLTSISVCWSNLIRRGDVLKVIPLRLGNYVFFGKMKDVQDCIIQQNCSEGTYIGQHKITTVIKHSPLECNYSHAEILMRHTFPDEKGITNSIVIKHDDWGKSLFKKYKSGPNKKFFKLLELDYRVTMATLLRNDSKELDIPFFLKLFSLNRTIKLSLFIRMALERLKR